MIVSLVESLNGQETNVGHRLTDKEAAEAVIIDCLIDTCTARSLANERIGVLLSSASIS
jgi:hypothetical protein